MPKKAGKKDLTTPEVFGMVTRMKPDALRHKQHKYNALTVPSCLRGVLGFIPEGHSTFEAPTKG